MLLAHAGQKHAHVEVLGTEPLQKDCIVFFGPHQVDMLVAGDPFFLAAGRDRPDLDHHGLLLFGLQGEALDTGLPEKAVVGFQTVIVPGGNIESRGALE